MTAVGHRADYERERDRADRPVAERLVVALLKATANLIMTREMAAKLEGEIAALRSPPQPMSWWRWLRTTG